MTHSKCDSAILFTQILDHYLIYERSLLNVIHFTKSKIIKFSAMFLAELHASISLA